MNSAPWFVKTYNVLLEGDITVALKTDQFLPPADKMLQQQSHQEQFGHAPIFFHFALQLNLA